MDITFWIVAIVAGVLSLTRLPGLSKSLNQSIFISGICVCIAFGLMIPTIYDAIDSLFPRTNFTDLFAKLALLLAVNILIGEIARTLGLGRARRLAAGLLGKTLLILVFGAEMFLFALTDTSKPSPGLGAFISDPTVLVYNGLTVLYIGVLGATVVPGLIIDVRKRSNPARCLASAFLAAGLSLAILRALLLFGGLLVSGMYEFGQIVSGFSALLVAAGLATAWVALRKATKGGIAQSHLRLE